MNARWSREVLITITEQSSSKAEVIRKLGLVDNGGNRRHLNMLLRYYDIEVLSTFDRKLNNIDINQLVKISSGYADFMKKCGLSVNTTNYRKVKKLIKDGNYCIDHFRGQGWNSGLTSKTSESVKAGSIKLEANHDDLFTENSKHGSSIARSHILKKN